MSNFHKSLNSFAFLSHFSINYTRMTVIAAIAFIISVFAYQQRNHRLQYLQAPFLNW